LKDAMKLFAIILNKQKCMSLINESVNELEKQIFHSLSLDTALLKFH